jgi:hypothetical protein
MDAWSTYSGTVEICTRDGLSRSTRWSRAFAAERKDHRYYEIIEDTIKGEFDYGYFVIKDGAATVRAVQPFFVLDQDLLVGASPRYGASIEWLRRAACMLQADAFYAENIGLDYGCAFDLHLYHYAYRDMVSWAIDHGYQEFRSGSLNYDPKLHFRHALDPIDLYVRHTSTLVNAALKLLLPALDPTRYDKTLKKFANFDQLRGH